MQQDTVLATALRKASILQLSRELGISRWAIYKWMKNGLPRSDHKGETNYVVSISTLSGVPIDDLLRSSEEIKRARHQ